MRKYHVVATLGIVFLTVGIALIAGHGVWAQDATPPPAPTPIENPPYLAGYYNAWVGSAHADFSAEAFRHWDSSAEGVVEPACARCHSEPGYIDYLGGDDTAVGTIENPVPLGSVITCDACHNSAARGLTEVTFPSGAVISDDGGSTRCMVCHQGRASTDSVDAKLTELGLVEDGNVVSADLGFINIHYFAAAASLYGGTARGGYQFADQVYMGKNLHVEAYDTCAECHSPHTLEVRVDDCATCHEDVETVEDLQYIRMNGSLADYDGDGDINEGIAEEIQGLQEILLSTIQTYAADVAGSPIAYSETAYPYFFIDTNENGEADADEAVNPNKYVSFTANLLRAAYNYQVTIKDPGGFAHNPSYHIELLVDSINMLNAQLGVEGEDPIVRDDPGHFNITAEAFRHWDAEGEVSGSCARCHSATGLPVWIENGANVNEPIANSLTCTTCHDAIPDFTVYQLEAVTFPSGAQLSFAPEGETDENNLCIACHQGRQSTVSVNTAITRAGVGDDEVSDTLAFANVHYFAAGATLFGSEAQGAYQFADHEYNGRNMHDGEEEAITCTDCHDTHNGERNIDLCSDCHDGIETQEDVRLIRMTEDVELVDYDGDGDMEEPIRDEIASFEDALLVAVQEYALATTGTAIAYDSHTNPYWFIDGNANGVVDPEEANRDNRFVTWTPNLLRAAYNYQYAQKDPGNFAHNPDYIMQVLFDSIEAVGGDVSTFTRPPVAVAAS